jgi:hypothetical protein
MDRRAHLGLMGLVSLEGKQRVGSKVGDSAIGEGQRKWNRTSARTPVRPPPSADRSRAWLDPLSARGFINQTARCETAQMSGSW